MIGSAERRAESTKRVVEMIRNHQLTVVAIGNGEDQIKFKRPVSVWVTMRLQPQREC